MEGLLSTGPTLSSLSINSRKYYFLVPALLRNSTRLALASNTIISCNSFTSGSCQVDGSVEEGGMPGEDPGHHWQTGPGISLCPACDWLEKGDSFVPQFSNWRHLLFCSLTKPRIESAIVVRFLAEFCYLDYTPLF